MTNHVLRVRATRSMMLADPDDINLAFVPRGMTGTVMPWAWDNTKANVIASRGVEVASRTDHGNVPVFVQWDMCLFGNVPLEPGEFVPEVVKSPYGGYFPTPVDGIEWVGPEEA